jgi:hypothetical protein
MKILEDNEELQKKFGTPEFFKIFQGMEKCATTDDSKTSFLSAFGFVDPTDFSKLLANATNSFQLKFAVDSLPRNTQQQMNRASNSRWCSNSSINKKILSRRI